MPDTSTPQSIVPIFILFFTAVGVVVAAAGLIYWALHNLGRGLREEMRDGEQRLGEGMRDGEQRLREGDARWGATAAGRYAGWGATVANGPTPDSGRDARGDAQRAHQI